VLLQFQFAPLQVGAALRDNKVHLPPSVIDAADQKRGSFDSVLIQGVNALVTAAAHVSTPREGSGWGGAD
jgi:hypothetical protein